MCASRKPEGGGSKNCEHGRRRYFCKDCGAVWVDPGHGPGEVSPDLGPTPGQAVEV